MATDLVSLFVIALVALVCPLITRLIPNKLIPETVFLIIAGALLGPNLAGAIQLTDSVELLSDLGLGFLFLLAGYEIDPQCLTGRQGRRGLVTWAVTFVIALLTSAVLLLRGGDSFEALALAIALTTTALGTLMPILKERGLMGTRVGDATLAYGTWGELGPILAMAVLLSSRSQWQTLLVLALFVGVCVLVALVQATARKAGQALVRFMGEEGVVADSQTALRMTVALLVGLVALSAAFDLDIVLGAFAAGFVLRYALPEGNEALERQLNSIAYGFFIPIFFVVSGTKIDLAAVVAQPLLLVGFIVMLLVVRAVPIYVSMATDKEMRDFSSHNRLTVALYCTTALPLIVAVTSLAVDAGSMEQDVASVLVAAGAVTVFLMPLLASVTYRVADTKPLEAAKEIAQNPREARDIVSDHLALQRLMARQEALQRVVEQQRELAAEGLGRAEAQARARDGLRRAHDLDTALDQAFREVDASSAGRSAHGGDGEGKVEGAGAERTGRADHGTAPAAAATTGPLYGVWPPVPEGLSSEAARELLARRQEERRRAVARMAVREYDRRMEEMGRLAARAAADPEAARFFRETLQGAGNPRPPESSGCGEASGAAADCGGSGGADGQVSGPQDGEAARDADDGRGGRDSR